ncbi:MAG: diadenylate cyclase CdaA [Phycisphaerales bacterium]|nr:diadenylate cyclase CdaA [Phycisphaerales bacterium]
MPQALQSIDLLELLVELAIIWIVVYVAYRFLRGTRGAGVLRGFAVLLVLLILLQLVGLSTERFARLDYLVESFVSLVAIMLVVIFQPELRQAAIRLGQAPFFRRTNRELATGVEAVSDAVDLLARGQFGAIIAIERTVRLGGLVEVGQLLDARLSAPLLQSIFWPNSPLHDLGVVIRGDRIVAAGVQFPLAEEGTVPSGLGSRHRAAIGLSAETDAIVVVVSEETGTVSLAVEGRLERPVPVANLADRLMHHLGAATAGDDADAGSADASDAGKAST